MRQKLFQDSQFGARCVVWNKLDVDVEKPPATQLDDVDESMLFMWFPNGIGLEAMWHPEVRPDGEFRVELVEYAQEWKPILQARCRSFSELQKLVSDFVETAKTRPAIPMPVLESTYRTEFNDFELDHTRPPTEQLERLKDKLFETRVGDDYVLRVGWEPPHDAAGEFVIRLLHYPNRLEDILDQRPPGGQVVAERRCRTIADLRAIVQDMTTSKATA